MKLVASRELIGFPMDIECRADGSILLLLLPPVGGQRLLHAFNPELAEIWTKPTSGRSLENAADGTNWVLEKDGATALDRAGDRLVHMTASVPQGMELSAFACLDDGFLFVCQKGLGMLALTPAVRRVSSKGEACWSVTLPVRMIAYGISRQKRGERWIERPLDPWMPREWMVTKGSLSVSDDAVFVCFSEKTMTGIGAGYVLSLSDGTLRFETQQGHIGEVAPLGEGAFLVGCDSETLRYERQGQVEGRWPARGHYVLTEGIRAIQQRCSNAHLVRLLGDGTVATGDRLDGYYTSRPYCHTDGTFFFFRNGRLLAARDLSIDDQLNLSSRGPTFSTKIAAHGRSMFFAYFAVSDRDKTQLVRIDF